MSIIGRDSRTGKFTMVSFSTIQKNGRTLLFPHMIDITDIKNTDDIVELVMEFQRNFKPQKETKEEKELRKAAEKAWAKAWNS